jgi:hypothetical protein
MVRSIPALLLLVAGVLGACSDGEGEVTVTAVRTSGPCQAPAGLSRELEIEMPVPGAFYTRHIPVEGWVDAAPGDPVEVRVTGMEGGLLGSGGLEVGEEGRNGRHRIEGIMMIQTLAARVAACVGISAAGRFVFVPVEVGGANP